MLKLHGGLAAYNPLTLKRFCYEITFPSSSVPEKIEKAFFSFFRYSSSQYGTPPFEGRNTALTEPVACYHPVRGWWSRTLSKNGTRRLTFSPADAWLDRPVTVSCGQCMGCRLAKSQDWVTRMMHERQYHDCASFITLTYSTEHVPISGGLVVSHLQKFLKRLRRNIDYHYGTEKKIAYYACGEYGSKNLRPHYHLVVFGEDFADDRRKHAMRRGHVTYRSPRLEKLWNLGFSEIGDVNSTTTAYVAKYVTKKVKVSDEATNNPYRRFNSLTGETWTVQREFQTSSRNPALGLRWFKDFGAAAIERGFCVIEGKKVPVPRYYLLKGEASIPELIKEYKSDVRRRMASKEVKFNNTPERLIVRETVKAAYINSAKRNLD